MKLARMLTRDEAALCREMRVSDPRRYPLVELAAMFETSIHQIKVALDQEGIRQRNRERARGASERCRAGPSTDRLRVRPWLRQFLENEPRTLTGRLLGDPPPGRSALDRQQGRGI